MKTEEFDALIIDTQKITTKMLIDKGEEYATGEDRLHNFRVAAQFKGESMQSALWGFAVKHLVSLSDMVAECEKQEDLMLYSQSKWDEKLMDAINYLTMLRVIRKDYCKGEIACVPEGSILLKERR